MGKIEDTKDKAVGKIMEAAGKVTNDQDMEFTGKFRTLTTQVKDKLYDVKEDVVQEANDLLDTANSKLKKKNN